MSSEWLATPMTIGMVAALHWINSNGIRVLPDDPPGGSRKRHARAIPMIGIALGSLVVVLLLALGSAWVALGAGLCTLLGYFDDRRKTHHGGLPLMVKVVCLAAAAVVAASAARGEWMPSGSWLLAAAFAFVVINAVNFLDNSNGVAVATGGLGLLLASGGHGPYAALGFLFLGFLPFNWPVPRLLLGDAGSLCLGYCLAVTALTRGVTSESVSLALFADLTS